MKEPIAIRPIGIVRNGVTASGAVHWEEVVSQIEIEPELAAAYNNLGFVFYRLGSYSEAIEMYNEAIGRNKDNAAAYTNLGNAYYKMKRVDEAIEAWKKALEIDPANEKARRNLRRFHAEVK